MGSAEGATLHNFGHENRSRIYLFLFKQLFEHHFNHLGIGYAGF